MPRRGRSGHLWGAWGLLFNWPLRSGLGVGGLLAVPENHELGGLHRRQADVANELAGVDLLLGHRGAVTVHIKRLLLARAHECAALPDTDKEVRNAASHTIPGGLAVRLEHHPLDALVDRLL